MKYKIENLLLIYLIVFPLYITSYFSTDWFYFALSYDDVFFLTVIIISILLVMEWVGIIFYLLIEKNRSKLVIKTFIASIIISFVGGYVSSHIDAELHLLFNYSKLSTLVEKIQEDNNLNSLSLWKIENTYEINGQLCVLNENEVDTTSESFPTRYYKDVINDINLDENEIFELMRIIETTNISYVSKTEEYISIDISFYGHGHSESVGYLYFPNSKPVDFDISKVLGGYEPTINHIYGNWYEYSQIVSK